MKTLYVLTEEPSAKNVFDALLPQILPPNTFYKILPHQGKNDLENALRTTLPTLSKKPNARILIVRDQDNDDCKELKAKLTQIISDICSCPYRIRIVCRELESWFLGDLEAIEKTYPRFKANDFKGKSQFRGNNVDKIVKPNLVLLKMIPELKERDTLPKLEVSRNIATNMSLQSNTSDSFNHTVNAINKLIST